MNSTASNRLRSLITDAKIAEVKLTVTANRWDQLVIPNYSKYTVPLLDPPGGVSVDITTAVNEHTHKFESAIRYCIHILCDFLVSEGFLYQKLFIVTAASIKPYLYSLKLVSKPIYLHRS